MKPTITDLLEELVRAPDTDGREWTIPRIGSVVGRFELLRELGRGGFGVVFEARDRELERLVALKAIRPGNRSVAELRERQLRREARAVARLSHPNIVTLYDFGKSEHGLYLILELLRGETLQQRLVRGSLPWTQALEIAIGVARATAHAHASGILHRDLKPSNVFLADDGGVKVLDFGLAHILGTQAARGSGTPAYMAPEQGRSEPEDERVDVFGLGVLLFEMLTGRLPYRVPEDRSAPTSADPVPHLEPGLAPAALADWIASALSLDPASRPRDGKAALGDLLEVKRICGTPGVVAEDGTPAHNARRRRLRIAVWAALGLTIAGMALAGYLLAARANTGGRVRLVVADFANDTGDRELDGLSGLLTTSLEQSPHLSVVARARLLDVMGRTEMDEPVRIDQRLGREAGLQMQARVLLLPAIHKRDGIYSIQLMAVDPRSGGRLFALEERGTGKGSVPELIDRISVHVRRELREQEIDVRASEVKVAEAVTSSLEAYQHYLASQRCMEATAYGQDCAAELERALSIDPSFALAHYQLAVWMSERGGTWARQRAAIDNAVRFAARVPVRERALIQAWKQHFDGRDDQALDTYQKLISAYPNERQPLYEAGDLLHHRGEFAEAARYFEKLLALDPGHAWALDHWVEALGGLRRWEELRVQVTHWTAAPPTPDRLHALCIAHGWLGDYPAAMTVARREAEAGGGLSARQDLLYASIFAGAYQESRAELEALAAPGSPARDFGYYALAAVDAYQGRRRVGQSRFSALIHELGVQVADAFFHSLRADYLAGDGDAGPVWEDARQLLALDPAAASIHAVTLAYLGDLGHAAELAIHLRPDTSRQQTYQALVRWHRGERDRAVEQLRQIADRAPFDADRGLAPAYLYGELAARAGADVEAVRALRDFQSLYIPTAMWRSWAYPRSHYLLAVSLERLGRRAEALEQVNRLLDQWTDAEPEQPLLKDARALRARLVAALAEAQPKP